MAAGGGEVNPGMYGKRHAVSASARTTIATGGSALSEDRAPPRPNSGFRRRPGDLERIEPAKAILAEGAVVDVREGFGRPRLAARDLPERRRMGEQRHLVAADADDLARHVRRAVAREKAHDGG